MSHNTTSSTGIKIAQMEGLIAQFDRLAEELLLAAEQEIRRTGIDDPNHFAFSILAGAALKRRANLLASSASMNAHLATVREQHEQNQTAERVRSGEVTSLRRPRTEQLIPTHS